MFTIITVVLFFVCELIEGQCDEMVAYSECIGNIRDIVVYFNNSCNKSDIIIKEIPCNFTCKNGEFFDFNDTGRPDYRCKSCPFAFESAGKIVVYDDFKTLPPGFSSWCSGNGCKNWTSKESILTPGFAIPSTNSYLSILFDTLQEVGQIKTMFSLPQVSTNSRFHAYFDGENIDSEFAETTLFYEHSHDTLYGRHNLTFEFITYESTDLIDIGPRISRVEIDGSEYLATACKLCPNGSHFDERLKICTRCPRGTFRVANLSNPSDFCQDCPDGYYSNPGASSCLTRAACEDDDITFRLTQCKNGYHSRVYYYVEPVICNTSNYTLPAPSQVLCLKCDPGTYRATNGWCMACAPGFYRNESMADSACEMCPAGTHAFGTSYIRNLDDIGDQFNTDCQDDHPYNDDDCAEAGWRAREGYLDSGNYHTGPVTVWMNKNVSSIGFGRVSFMFTTHMAADSYFMFEITGAVSNDEQVNEVFTRNVWTNQNNGVQQNYTGYFFSNNTRLEWFFIKEGPGLYPNHTRISDYVTIEEIEIITGLNSTIGGSTACEVCPNGTAAGAGSVDCTLCMAGTAAEAQSAECTPCTGNTVAENNFASACVDCTEELQANEDHTKCLLTNCGFSVNDTFTFDIAGLKNEEAMYGPLAVPINNYSYYINVCSKEHSDIYCHGAFNNISTYACYVTNAGMRFVANTGSLPHFQLYEDSANNRYGVNLTYSLGDSSNCSPGDHSSTEIDIICSQDSNNSVIHPRAEDFATDGCHYHFEWFSEYGCRLCHPDDFTRLDGPCVDKKRNVSYSQSASPCAHGYTLPNKWYIEACKVAAVQISTGGLVGIIVGGVIVLVAAVVAIIFFLRRNRAIRYQLYQKSKFALSGQDESGLSGGLLSGGGGSEDAAGPGGDGLKVSF